MIFASCPLRISLFGGSTDNPYFVDKYGYGSVISFTSNLKTYVTINQDKFGFNKDQHKYIINYSRREEVNNISEIQNDVVRVVLEYFNIPPVQVTLTSDAYSQGSGLASSSSYIISLIKACCIFLNEKMTDHEICNLAHKLEISFNPYCGYQDPYGCGIGGFKRIEFLRNNKVRYEFLPSHILDNFSIQLVFTGVTRNSKPVLRSVTENLEKITPLVNTVNKAHEAILTKDYLEFFNLLNEGWEQKKNISSIITKNKRIRNIDSSLGEMKSIFAHKLCGAGNGGFFLTFSEKNSLTSICNSVIINPVTEGVLGESI
jgi:D-glycero-alpha-D-manno-heptose-7-phosphate kinase